MRNRGAAGRRRPPRRALAGVVALVASVGACARPTEAPRGGAGSVAQRGGSERAEARAEWAEARPTEAAERAEARAEQGEAAERAAEGEAEARAEAEVRAARRQAAAGRLALAEELLCSYQDASKYPFTSRPIAEHPDQVYPNRPVGERRVLRRADGTRDTSLRIHTTQSRVYMAAGESVVFTLAATDEDGGALPLRVERAEIRGLPVAGGAAPQARALVLADDGRRGDAVAGDGTLSGRWSPGAEVAGFAGTLRAEVVYTAAERAGVAWFDVFYSQEVPARWSGPIRAVVEGGDLAFYLPARVQAAGRYLVSARVDDAGGEPLALLTFNDLVAAGEQEIRLGLHGKLIRDLAPRFPLRLRDIDGFLLREDTDPDRALMPRLEGVAHTTRGHRLAEFSAEEWQSEERARYLAEFGRDVEAARAALAELEPGQVEVGFTPEQCRRFTANAGLPRS